MRRGLFLLTLAAAMVFACAGVVLAQTSTPDSSEESSAQEPGTERPTTTRGSATNQESSNQESSGRGKAPLQARDPQSAVPDQYIVVLNDDEDADKVAKEHKDKDGVEANLVYKRALKGYAAKLSEAQLEKIRSDERVLFVSEDREVQADAQSVPTGIKRIGGESSDRTNKGSGAGVAVLDTGIDLTHPDLSGVQSGKNCIDTSKSANDDHGHGTHVAGTIA